MILSCNESIEVVVTLPTTKKVKISQRFDVYLKRIFYASEVQKGNCNKRIYFFKFNIFIFIFVEIWKKCVCSTDFSNFDRCRPQDLVILCLFPNSFSRWPYTEPKWSEISESKKKIQTIMDLFEFMRSLSTVHS